MPPFARDGCWWLDIDAHIHGGGINGEFIACISQTYRYG